VRCVAHRAVCVSVRVLLWQVAYEFTLAVDTGAVSYRYPGGGDDLLEVLGSGLYELGTDKGPSLHQALVAALVHAHQAAQDVTHKLAKRATRRSAASRSHTQSCLVLSPTSASVLTHVDFSWRPSSHACTPRRLLGGQGGGPAQGNG
jgi:hypothetical protein